MFEAPKSGKQQTAARVGRDISWPDPAPHTDPISQSDSLLASKHTPRRSRHVEQALSDRKSIQTISKIHRPVKSHPQEEKRRDALGVQ